MTLGSRVLRCDIRVSKRRIAVRARDYGATSSSAWRRSQAPLKKQKGPLMTLGELLDRKKKAEHPDAYRDHVDTLQYCHAEDNVDELKGSVKMKKQGALPVLDAQGGLIGVVTRFDLDTKDGVVVGDVMTTPPVVVRADDTVGSALSLMSAHKVKKLPVIDQGSGHCTGMVSELDVLPFFNSRQARPTSTPGTEKYEDSMLSHHHNIDM
ncbi:hypothetical protein M9435_001669 [Picochlorum sp. BPE23]|nr:hypothetical protein M9435_001669 [Picochlorum sp. BPE23]